MCQKVRYSSPADAQRNLRYLRHRKIRKDRALNVYRCRECVGQPYHIGHAA